jgi:hypothetical protein
MNISTLRRGDAIELLVNANTIPAGCYRFHEIRGEMSVFTLGHEVIIGLATDFWTQFMRPAVTSKLSSASEFAKRYGRLQAQFETQDSPPEPSRITFCVLSSRVLKQSTLELGTKVEPINASELIN